MTDPIKDELREILKGKHTPAKLKRAADLETMRWRALIEFAHEIALQAQKRHMHPTDMIESMAFLLHITAKARIDKNEDKVYELLNSARKFIEYYKIGDIPLK